MNYARPKPCARCGLEGLRRSSSALCQDCRYTMSKAEQALWREPAKVVESSQGKVAA